MSAPTQTSRLSFRIGQPARRNLGLVGLSIALVGASEVSTSETGRWGIVLVVAVATATGMYGRLAVGRWGALAQITGGSALVFLLGGPPRLAVALLATGVAASEFIARLPRRSATLRVGAWLALVAGATTFIGAATSAAVPGRVALVEILGSAIGGFLSAPLLFMLAPLAEGLFGHVTRLTMNEWLSYEHPLLRRLASIAPGTFQHSINVGVLADAAAAATGADAFLTRVGGMYHDVGKMNAPIYFIENQHGPNPHDQLQPDVSATILRAHVLDGVELVRQHRMGERIADFVREHHGTSEMRLLRAKAASLGQSATDDTYRYPGPSPRTRETGIVMIADQVEATARSKPPADDTECDAIVRTTIERIRDEGQLDESGLTATDLERAQLGLSRALQAMYHRRLSYPASGTGASSRPLVLPTRPQQGATP